MNKYVKTFESFINEDIETKYKLVFQNQSVASAAIYKLVRETDKYVFLLNIKGDSFTLRVSKKTLKVRAFADEYSFDMPTAIQLIKLDSAPINKSIKQKNVDKINETPELKEEFEEFTQYCLSEVGIDTIIDFLKVEDKMNFNLSISGDSINFSKEEPQSKEEDILAYIKRKTKNRYTWEQIEKRLKQYYFVKMMNEIPSDKEFQSMEEAGNFLKIYTQKFIYGYLIPMSKKGDK